MIENEADLAKAIRAVAFVKGGETARTAVRRLIVARAAALDLAAPSDWLADGTVQVQVQVKAKPAPQPKQAKRAKRKPKTRDELAARRTRRDQAIAAKLAEQQAERAEQLRARRVAILRGDLYA